jgi:hypothetical protein
MILFDDRSPVPGSTGLEHEATLDQLLAHPVPRPQLQIALAGDWLNRLLADSIPWRSFREVEGDKKA